MSTPVPQSGDNAPLEPHVTNASVLVGQRQRQSVIQSWKDSIP